MTFGRGNPKAGKILKKLVLSGKKTSTTQVHRYGNVGDTFTVSKTKFKITKIKTMKLGQALAKYHKKEGFSSPEELKEIWLKFHTYRAKWSMSTRVYVYMFRRVK